MSEEVKTITPEEIQNMRNNTMLPMYSLLTAAELERLTVLNEELAEVLKESSKIIRHGYESYHPRTMEVNRQLLETELGHVLSAMNRMVIAGDIDKKNVDAAKEEKTSRKQQYLHHQD